MLTQYSHVNKKTKAEVESLVGAPFSLWQRVKMNGNGSQRLALISGNDEVINILNSKSTTDPYINIEMRPKGVIIHFRVRLDNWALVLPFYSLSIFYQNNQLNIYSGKWKLSLMGYRNSNIRHDFMQKLLGMKAKAVPEAS